MTLNPCNSSLNDTFVSQIPEIVRSFLDAGNEQSLNVTLVCLPQSGNVCNYSIAVTHTSGSWTCAALAAKLTPASIEQAVTSSPAFSSPSVSVKASQVSVTVFVAPTPGPESPIPFSPYVIIIPAVIVVVLFGVCLWMWCARPKIKRQERPVFDGFEMGDAQQLESSSNLEFAVPEVEFEDPRGGSKHRLTIN